MMVVKLDREVSKCVEELGLLVHDVMLPGNSQCSEVTAFS
jgi:hypothetical protein